MLKKFLGQLRQIGAPMIAALSIAGSATLMTGCAGTPRTAPSEIYYEGRQGTHIGGFLYSVEPPEEFTSSPDALRYKAAQEYMGEVEEAAHSKIKPATEPKSGEVFVQQTANLSRSTRNLLSAERIESRATALGNVLNALPTGAEPTLIPAFQRYIQNILRIDGQIADAFVAANPVEPEGRVSRHAGRRVRDHISTSPYVDTAQRGYVSTSSIFGGGIGSSREDLRNAEAAAPYIRTLYGHLLVNEICETLLTTNPSEHQLPPEHARYASELLKSSLNRLDAEGRNRNNISRLLALAELRRTSPELRKWVDGTINEIRSANLGVAQQSILAAQSYYSSQKNAPFPGEYNDAAEPLIDAIKREQQRLGSSGLDIER
jgi:hypothetical protein